ncbi:MAG: type II toxin-antitoxin system HicB family antitoxin [Gammaproteobacteria bacterium]|jgi:predicted HicB family RNase H-like nuclease|nr:type II toxin-antitoxin system HicB family antitoxin [Gammaproteobacteria bacterium]
METLHYKEYEGSIEPSIEDRCLHGKILFVNDLVTYEGKTIEELDAAFRESVDEYLAFCAEVGKAPEKPYKGVFNVRVRPETHKTLVTRAYHSQQSLNEFVCKAIEAYLEEELHHTHHHVHEHVLREQPKRVRWTNEVSQVLFATAFANNSDPQETDDFTAQLEETQSWKHTKIENYGHC